MASLIALTVSMGEASSSAAVAHKVLDKGPALDDLPNSYVEMEACFGVLPPRTMATTMPAMWTTVTMMLKMMTMIMMGDDSWTVNLFMKDAPSSENFLEQTMDRDLICYFDIFGLVEKYGYTTSDALYYKRDSHGRHKACLVKISNDNDVGKMLLEHEADRKLSFFVEKRTANLNMGVHFAAPTHTGSSDDAMEGYDTESSNESDHETDRDELDHESEAMKRGRFTVSNVMNIKSGGKVIIETDEKGVPNQRSAGLLGSFLRGLAKNSSHVPLHIPRWDNKLMRKPKKNLITYVEEVKNKGPISKIDLWDEAHKKKDGTYTNENVQQLMHKARKELAIFERKKNGKLSPEDYDKVFDDVIAKDSTIGRYYGEKYWGDARLCRGSTSVPGASSEVTIKKGNQQEDPTPMLQSNNITMNILDRFGGDYEVDGVERPMANVHTTGSDPKVTLQTMSLLLS
ncbi:hypothetical protein ACQ4PT_038681 [Festuca glaucescens]